LISFRYHLVSIVAVFLALALGVLLGTTVVNQGVTNELNRRTDQAVSRANQLKEQVAQQQAELGQWDRFARSIEPLLVRGQLAGDAVVLVTQVDVEPAEVDGVRKVLEEAGATVVADLVATDRLALSTPDARRQLAALVGVPDDPADPARVQEAAARRLAARLAAGPTGSEGDDLLAGLRDAGFLVMRGTVGLAQIGGPDQAVVMLAGGPAQPSVEPEAFLQPLAAALVRALRPVVAAETSDSAYDFVGLLRRDGATDGRLVTVDNADQMPGRVAVVLGLRDLLLSPARGGDYGVKDGASSLIPSP
jgi:hypothetical protein